MTLREYCEVFGIAEFEDALWHAVANDHPIHASGKHNLIVDEAIEMVTRDPDLVEIEL
ncbi:MAG: hypothetical protein AB7S38_38205 [Vulcanimicrobiota bacterium]